MTGSHPGRLSKQAHMAEGRVFTMDFISSGEALISALNTLVFVTSDSSAI